MLASESSWTCIFPPIHTCISSHQLILWPDDTSPHRATVPYKFQKAWRDIRQNVSTPETVSVMFSCQSVLYHELNILYIPVFMTVGFHDSAFILQYMCIKCQNIAEGICGIRSENVCAYWEVQSLEMPCI